MHYRSYVNRDLKTLDGWSPQPKKKRSRLPLLLAGLVVCAAGATLILPIDAEATLSRLFPGLDQSEPNDEGALELTLPAPEPQVAVEPKATTPEESGAPIADDQSGTVTIGLALPPMDQTSVAPAMSATGLGDKGHISKITPPSPEPAKAPEKAAAESKAKAAEKPTTAATEPTRPWKEVTIRKGDNLAAIFDRLGADRGDLHRIISLGGAAKELKSIHPGNTLSLKLAEDGHVLGIRYPLDKLRTLLVEGNGKRFQATIDELAVERRQAFVAGTIENSLYLAAQRAGMPENLIMELANIFGWDIDFALDIRKGDSFSVVFEELHTASGEKIEDGPILAAEFISQGKSFQAVRYVDPKGVSNYFTPEGRSMRKAFLRSPVDFRRISSKFQRERWHPVTGKKRPHRGVDYAASTGTPIKASGDGKVTFVGRKGGYGKTVVIKHGQQYTTLYAHLNGYKRGIKRGKWVKQGQTIGYVGKTGLATGPHLHYEFRVNGVHRNPLTVKLPKAASVPKKYRGDFQRQTQPLMAALELRKSTLLARNDVE